MTREQLTQWAGNERMAWWIEKHLPYREGRYRSGGLGGMIVGSRTFTRATTTKAIINGDHTLLSCEEHHSHRIVLGAGTYDAEIKTEESCSPTLFHSCGAPDVWINYVRPVDHKVFRQHWKVAGSW
jgi:hypothetical protein